MLRLRCEKTWPMVRPILPLASHVSQPSLPCDACAAGKSHRQPVPKTATHRATRCLELVHSDMWGPIDVDAHDGLDRLPHLRRRLQPRSCRIPDEGQERSRCIDSPHGLQGVGREHHRPTPHCASARTTVVSSSTGPPISSFVSTVSLRQVTTAYTSSQNGVAERFNRTIMDTVRSMLHHANLADSFWPLAVQAATYVREPLSDKCSPAHDATPSLVWPSTRPSLATCVRLRGVIYTFPSRVDDRINKLSARSVPCINVGYSLRSKGYLLYNPRTRRVRTSKDATFEETRFIGADSPLARRHIGEGEMSVLFPDCCRRTVNSSCLSTDPVQPLDHDLPAIAAEDIDDELVEAGPSRLLGPRARRSRRAITRTATRTMHRSWPSAATGAGGC